MHARRQKPWTCRSNCCDSKIPPHDRWNRIRDPSKPWHLPSRTTSECKGRNLSQGRSNPQRTCCPIWNLQRSQTGTQGHHSGSSWNGLPIRNWRQNTRILKSNARTNDWALTQQGGCIGLCRTKTLLSERDTEWNVSKVPQLYFNTVEKAMRGLTRAGINSDLNKRRDMALFYLKELRCRAVREWEAKPAADKTWVNIKNFISTEYAK